VIVDLGSRTVTSGRSCRRPRRRWSSEAPPSCPSRP